MSDLKTLYKFSENFEAAAKTILENAGVPMTFKQRGKEKLPATRVDIQFTLGGEFGHYTKSEGKWLNDMWNANLRFQISADRKNAPAFVEEAKAAIRQVFADWKTPFNEALTYYRVVAFKDAGATHAIQTETDRDVCVMLYTVIFGIKSDAWPAAA